jgi:hypothetical protein
MLCCRRAGSPHPFACTARAWPSTPPGRRYRARLEARPPRRSRIACGMSLWARRVSAVCRQGRACGRGLRTFDGRVIFVDEVALDKLDGQTTLSNTTATDDHQLVFPEELQKFTVSRGLGLLSASVARSHRAQSHWRRPAVGGGACILSTPLLERRVCSKRREVEASGRFASHGRLKEIDL